MTDPEATAENRGPLRRLLDLRFLRFVAVGGFTWAFASAQVYLYTELLQMSRGPAYALTQVAIVLVNFVLARYWIFDAVSGHPLAQGAKFIVAVIAFRGADWCVFMIVSGVFGIPYYAAIFVALVVVFPAKYLTYKIGVFNSRDRPSH